jgi:hypothetical protein
MRWDPPSLIVTHGAGRRFIRRRYTYRSEWNGCSAKFVARGIPAFEQRRSLSQEENLHQLVPERLQPILRLAQASMQRLHGGDGSAADELLAAQDTQTLRELRQAASLLEYHARVQLYTRNERQCHANRGGVLIGSRP